MMGRSLTRAEIADALQNKAGLSRADALLMVGAILGHMGAALERGENVKIAGFGAFVLNDKRERIGRNPRTGAEARVSARRVMTFRGSQALKDRVASGLG